MYAYLEMPVWGGGGKGREGVKGKIENYDKFPTNVQGGDGHTWNWLS